MFLAWRLGQDVSWDLRNYHFYNAYGLLDNRFTRDFEPAGVQSYFNPILDIPFYVAVKIWKLRPIVIGLAHASFHGLNLWLVYRLVTLLVSGAEPELASIAAAAAAVTGAFGAAFSMGVGSSSGDNTMSVLVLAALVVLVSGIEADLSPPRRSVRISALLIGLATGAKPVAAMYAIGLVAALLVIRGGIRQRVRRIVDFGVFAAIGLLITHGYWMWLMFRHFGNPMWPFLDASMHSPYVQVSRYLASRFMPRTVTQAIFYPFFFAGEQQLVSEVRFSDPRFAVAFVCVVLFGGVALVRRWRSGAALRTTADVRTLAFVTFVVASYLAWERLSSVYRYAVSIELTAAALLCGFLAYWLRSTRRALIVAIPVCLLIVAFTKPGANAHVPWSETYFGVDEAALSAYGDSTILMTDFPNAYIAPFFPESATFIRVSSNWSFAAQAEVRTRVRQRIRNVDPRRIFLLDLPQAEPKADQENLELLGLALDMTRCTPLSTLFESGRICGVVDVGAAAPPSLASASPTAPASYEGFHDITNCNGIMGWAWDRAHPDAPLEIDVFDGTRFLTRVSASEFRQNLVEAKKGNGRHGFTLLTPSELRDGKPHDIWMKYAGTMVNLSAGPKPLTCLPQT